LRSTTITKISKAVVPRHTVSSCVRPGNDDLPVLARMAPRPGTLLEADGPNLEIVTHRLNSKSINLDLLSAQRSAGKLAVLSLRVWITTQPELIHFDVKRAFRRCAPFGVPVRRPQVRTTHTKNYPFWGGSTHKHRGPAACESGALPQSYDTGFGSRQPVQDLVRSAACRLGGKSAIANERSTCAAPQEVRLNCQVDSHHRTQAEHLLTSQTRSPILGTKRAPEKRRRAPSGVISMYGAEEPNSMSGKHTDALESDFAEKSKLCVMILLWGGAAW
jgi:hypothetical protein